MAVEIRNVVVPYRGIARLLDGLDAIEPRSPGRGGTGGFESMDGPDSRGDAPDDAPIDPSTRGDSFDDDESTTMPAGLDAAQRQKLFDDLHVAASVIARADRTPGVLYAPDDAMASQLLGFMTRKAIAESHLKDLPHGGLEVELDDDNIRGWLGAFVGDWYKRLTNKRPFLGNLDLTLPTFGQGASYFAYQNDHFVLVGLDTGYDAYGLAGNQDGWLDAVVRNAGAQIRPREGGGLRLGALVTNTDVAYHPLVEARYPLLSAAILAGASPQLRNMATVGGNLMQRTRCYYFYDTATPCNKREPGSGCPAIAGLNRIHAILGTSDRCIATHPSDMCVALAALEAIVQVTGPDGERAIPMTDFHRLPGDTPHLDTTLRPGEIVTEVDLPERGFAERHTYLKVRDRASYAFALVSVAAALELSGDTVTDARVALGGVAHKPWRDRKAEELLVGQSATPESFRRVAEALLEGARASSTTPSRSSWQSGSSSAA